MPKITIDKLATMIQGEFSSIHKDFARLEGRVDTLEGKIEKGLTRLEEKIDDVGLKLSAQGTTWNQDFEKLEGRVEQNEIDTMALNKIVLKKR